MANINNYTKGISDNINGKSNSPFKKINAFQEDIGRPSLALPDLNSSDFLTRESLGILSSSFLCRNSLTKEQLNLESMKHFEINDISPRESLGLLDLSALDLGRESLQIFDIRESLIRHKSSGGLSTKSPVDKVPIKVTISTTDDIVDDSSVGLLNQALLYSDSAKLSTNSSIVSCNPHFSFKSLYEPSPILPLNSYNTYNDSKLATSDSLNDAFKFFGSVNNKCSMSQIIVPTTPDKVLVGDSLRNKIKSLPFTLEERPVLKTDSEEALDDSVFLEGRKIAIEISNSYCIEDKSTDSSRYNLLDSIPEPNWPSDLDVSQNMSAEKQEYNRETVSKKIDRMMNLKPVNLNEKLMLNQVTNNSNEEQSDQLKNNSKLCQDVSPGNRSILSNNKSQNISKVSHSSNDSILRIIRNLSDYVKEKESLSTSRKSEVLHTLNFLASDLSDNKSEQVLSEDSGHSSVDEQQKSKSSENISDNIVEGNLKVNCSKTEEYHALDLSCKNKSASTGDNKNICISLGFSPGSLKKPPPYVPKTSKGHALNVLNTSGHIGGQKRPTNDAVAKSVNISSKATNASHTKAVVSGKLRKSKAAPIVAKKGPLRAVLPLENMAKGSKSHTTPERNENAKMMLKSSRTSTPIQEVTLKPTVTSTPTSCSSKGKGCAISPLSSKPKYYRSFSEKMSTPNSTKKTDKSRESICATSKTSSKPLNKPEPAKVRRNSVSEGVTNRKSENPEGAMRLKRSFSTGKEHKLMSALSKVRQSILNSPYYHRAGNTSGNQAVLTENNRAISSDNKISVLSTSNKPGKENIKQ